MLRSIEVDIARRLSFSKQQRAFTRWVAGFAALGMALGVASLIVVLSVMNGLAGELTGRLLNAIPHVELRFIDYDGDAQALAERVELSQPGIAAAPYLKRQVMARSEFGTAGAELMGLETGSTQRFNARVVDGSLQEVMTQPYHIALGAVLANSLGVGIGDSIEVVLPRLSITPFGVLPRYRKLRVGAVVSVGASPDASMAVTSLETMKKLSGVVYEDGIRLQLKDPNRADSVAQLLEGEYRGRINAVTWTESYGSLFSAIRMEKIMVSILLSALIAVAAFNVVSSLTMSVAEKRSDIASLRVLGLTVAGVRRIFLLHGLMLATFGIALGTVIGVLMSLNLRSLMALVERVFGWTLFDPSVYYIGGLPTDLQGTDIGWVVSMALGLSLVAAVYPAHRASKISPVSALDGLEAY